MFPDRKTIATICMPKLYYYCKIKSILHKLHRVGKAFLFTTDMWRSRSTHPYVSFTIHFINDEYELFVENQGVY